jgi:glutamyl-Q tRNA(Asp) synthetase
MPPVFRFAPSPNGYLHLGHALSALTNADMARAAGGRLLLRIEDIDTTRCRPEYETAIDEDLAWLGLRWEQPGRRQSEHQDDYRAALARLDAMGLVYPSFESRAAIARLVAERETQGPWPRDPDGAPLYPGAAKSMPAEERDTRIVAGQSYALRLNMQAALARAAAILAEASPSSPPPLRERSTAEGGREGDRIDNSADAATSLPIPPPQGGREEGAARAPILTWKETGAGPDGETGMIRADPARWGDVILARKDVPGSYHLSVVVDDAAQGVTDVVRGRDLFHATSVHRLLQALLGLPAPRYHHHRLLLDAHGAKLSKSTRATGLRELRTQGLTPSDIRRLAGLD